MRMSSVGLCLAWYQVHAALGTGTWLVLYHLRMHGAGIFDADLQHGRVKVGDVGAEGALGNGTA